MDRRWALIFVRCAGPTVELQDRLELAEQAIFLRHHHQQVTALETLANQVITKAAGSTAG